MKIINYFFVLLLFGNVAFAMEDRENEKPSVGNLWSIVKLPNTLLKRLNFFVTETKEEKKEEIELDMIGCPLLEILNDDLLIYIGDLLLLSNEELIKKVKNHLVFCMVLLRDNRTKHNDLRKKSEYVIEGMKYKEGYVKFLSNRLGINPFFVANKLKVRLSYETENRYECKALENELKKRNITQDELADSLKNNNNLFIYNLVEREGDLSLIGILALVKIENLDLKSLVSQELCTISSPTTFQKKLNGESCGKVWKVNSNSLLAWAVFNDSEELVKMLLNVGFDPNQKIKLGTAFNNWTTPICCAVFKRNVKICRSLLNAGADPNLEDVVPALVIAIFPIMHDEIYNLLILNGAKATRQQKAAYSASIQPPIFEYSYDCDELRGD